MESIPAGPPYAQGNSYLPPLNYRREAASANTVFVRLAWPESCKVMYSR
jgi:hypothetical protein